MVSSAPLSHRQKHAPRPFAGNIDEPIAPPRHLYQDNHLEEEDEELEEEESEEEEDEDEEESDVDENP